MLVRTSVQIIDIRFIFEFLIDSVPLQNLHFLSYATPYDTIDLTTGRITPAAYKTPLAGREAPVPAPVSLDIFNSPDNPHGDRVPALQFVLAATGLFNSTSTQSVQQTWESQPTTLTLRFVKDAQSVGWQGVVNGVSYISYQDLRIDVQPL
jgi:hypothetical protein